MTEARYKVFVSYSSQDKGIADLIGRCIEASRGRAYLYQRDQAVGAKIKESLRHHIRDADELLLLLTPSFADSVWAPWELATAEAYGKPVMAVLHEVDVNSTNGPATTRGWQTMINGMNNISLGAIIKYLDELTGRIYERESNHRNDAEIAAFKAELMRDADELVNRLARAIRHYGR